MSYWLVGLGIGIGYLMKQNQNFASYVKHAVDVHERETEVSGATPDVSDQMIKNAKRNTTSVNYGRFNPNLPKAEKDQLVAATVAEERAVRQYDAGAEMLQTQPVEPIADAALHSYA